MKRCKTLLCLALALIMALSLCTVAMAEEPTTEMNTVTEIKVEVTDYVYGGKVDRLMAEVSVATNNGMGLQAPRFSVTIDDRGLYANEELTLPVTSEYFNANQDYWMGYKFFAGTTEVTNVVFPEDNNDIKVTCTVNGQSVQAVTGFTTDKAFNVRIKLPTLTAVPFEIPFVADIVKGGDVVPGTGNFELAVANSVERSNSPIGNYTIGNLAYTTNGVGKQVEAFTITNDDYSAILNLLDEGIFVTQKEVTAKGWSHDDGKWLVQRKNWNDVADDLNTDKTESDYFVIVAKKVGDDNAKWCYVKDMTFTNTYTENTPAPTPKPSKPATTVVEAPKTFDGGVALCAALSVLSMTGAVVVGKKRDK